MAERILFLTGKLAEPSVHQVLQEMAPCPLNIVSISWGCLSLR